jgi:site-specific DNA-methyltransferase (adenine-specific)
MINLYNADCLSAMLEMETDQFDLAIVDPPYGIGEDGDRYGERKPSKVWKNPKAKNYTQKDWDKERPSKKYFDELLRVSKNQIIWGANYFTDLLPVSGGWAIWSKGVPETMSLSMAEMAWISHTNSVKIKELLWSGYKKCEQVDRIHPTQKPAKLYTWLLSMYAKEGDTILDTHLGSGSIAIACHDMGFDLTAYEIDEEYFAAASNRLKQHQRQLKLF